jgi:hypothetical protein
VRPSEFPRRLATVGPTELALEQAGVTPVNCDRFARAFRCIERTTTGTDNGRTVSSYHSDSIGWLLERWDLSAVEIGMFHFLPHAILLPYGIQIGEVEVDPVITRSNSEEVIVIDRDDPSHILWYAAASIERLLDALVLAAEFLAKRMLKQIGVENSAATRRQVSRCAEAAGGHAYVEFYSMLLGANA